MNSHDAEMTAALSPWLGQRLPGQPGTVEILMKTPVQIRVRFGWARMTLRDALELKENSVVDLDRAGDGVVEILINNSVIVTGEMVAADGKYGVRILQVAGNPESAGRGSLGPAGEGNQQ